MKLIFIWTYFIKLKLQEVRWYCSRTSKNASVSYKLYGIGNFIIEHNWLHSLGRGNFIR